MYNLSGTHRFYIPNLNQNACGFRTNEIHSLFVPIIQGLFRKVCLSEITPSDLVRMKSEQYASDELAEWREKTLKKVRAHISWSHNVHQAGSLITA